MWPSFWLLSWGLSSTFHQPRTYHHDGPGHDEDVALNDDLKACREASRFDASQEDKQRNTVEFNAVTTHLMWIESVGDN